jgi:chromosome segregation ATPase
MPAFDEMLALEERIQSLEVEIAKARDLVRQCSRRLLDTKTEIQKIEKNLETLAAHFKFLRESRIVLLSEYEDVVKLLRDNRSLLVNKRQEANRLLKQGRDTQAGIPAIEARIKQAEKELESYGQVIPFRHEST